MAGLSARSVYPVVLFIVAILFVAAIVIGVIFFVSERGEQVRRDKAQEVAAQQLRDDETAQEETSDDDEQPATAPVVEGVTREEARGSSETTDATPRPTNEALPVTGPVGDALGAIAILGLVSLTVAYYLTSRKALLASRL